MSLDAIRDEIATCLSSTCDDQWFEVLDNTTPGHYGVDDMEFRVDRNDIWVDVPKNSFTFKKGHLSFTARIGGSSEESGADVSVKRTVSGYGTFTYPKGGNLTVTNLDVNEPIDLFEGD